jgi:hypothetical protein
VTQRLRTWSAAAAIVAALGLVLAGQAWGDAMAPATPNGALTGQAVGRAGFAYLTGLRRFGAALLWNRLEPQMHEYYGEVGLGKMVFMLPNIKAIVTLDPQFVEAYYVAPQILISSGVEPGVSQTEAANRLKTGLELAREGTVNNPKSGIVLVSYAQLLMTEAKDLKAAVPYAEAALASDIVWRTDEEQWNMYAVLRAVFKQSGDTVRVAQVQAVMDAIAADPNATKDAVDRDE